MGRSQKRTVTALIDVEIDGPVTGDDIETRINRVLARRVEPESTCHTIRDAFDTVGVTVADVDVTVETTSHDSDRPGCPGFNAVSRVTRRWYYREIRCIADDLIKRCSGKPGERRRGPRVDAREWLTEEVGTDCGDHSFVIYTAQSYFVLAASDNATAYEDDIGGDEPGSIEARASWAMRADVWQLLEARSDEWDDTDTTAQEAHDAHNEADLR